MSEFFLVLKGQQIYNDEIIYISSKNKLYKTLSLYIAKKTGIKIAPTALFLEENSDVLKYLISEWKIPLMMRMDYSSLPKKKFLGGIPIYDLDKLKTVSLTLLSNNFYPLFHTHIDRFKDLYSAGVSFSSQSNECIAEFVGKGFDASDLRLGNSIPHEFVTFDVLSQEIFHRSYITSSQYRTECMSRKIRIMSFKKYIEYVNQTGLLVTSLNQIQNIDNSNDNSLIEFPENYTCLPNSKLKSLINIVFLIKKDVIKDLPKSSNYVASFSYIPENGWILWDIYGSWYKR